MSTNEYDVDFTIKAATTQPPQPYSVRFQGGAGLKFNPDGSATFSGDADEAARMFFDCVIRNWSQYREGFQEKLTAAEKRIAELEARAVELPLPGCTYADHSYPAYTKRQVLNLLAAAGITVKGDSE